MPFEWTLNPYRGCTHGCHYCYARRYHTQFELGADDEFASIIFVKTNFVDVLRRELRKPSWAARLRRRRHGDRLLSADRRPLQADARHARGAVRAQEPGRRRDQGTDDRARHGRARRSVSAPRAAPSTSACPAWTRTPGAQLEPGTAPPLQRLRAVRELVDAGIRAGVLMNPIVPGHLIEAGAARATMKAIADHGARFVGCNVMFLRGRHARSLHALAGRGAPGPGRGIPPPLRAQVRAGRVPQGGARGLQSNCVRSTGWIAARRKTKQHRNRCRPPSMQMLRWRD